MTDINKEDKNMARIELSDEMMEDVHGGVFHFQYNKKGQYACKVDGIGTFYADESAKRKINMHDVAEGPFSDQELVNWAISQGLLWKP